LKVSQILQRIKKAYHLETDAEVADFLDIKPSTLSMQKNRGRLNLKLIIEKCRDVNKNWLLDGVGPVWSEPGKLNGKQIPVYSTLSIRNNRIDPYKSTKQGYILLEMLDESNELNSDHIIGYSVSKNIQEIRIPDIKKKGIIFIDLTKKEISPDRCFLFSNGEKLIYKSVRKDSESHSLTANGTSEEHSNMNQNNSSYNIIGEIICMMHKL